MNGIERIAAAFAGPKPVKLMTHVVGGYPDMATCERLVLAMAARGADLVELQLPFSDPPADGPVIVQANHAALAAGVTTGAVLELIARLRRRTDVPLLVMSYLNPLWAWGLEDFCRDAAAAGATGLIVPDNNIDEDLGLLGAAQGHGLALVPLVAPTTPDDRLAALVAGNHSPFLYAVLRLGVTGRRTELDGATAAYLARLRRLTGKHVAAGFGIQTLAQVDLLAGHADCGIVGSAVIRLVDAARTAGQDPVAVLEREFFRG